MTYSCLSAPIPTPTPTPAPGCTINNCGSGPCTTNADCCGSSGGYCIGGLCKQADGSCGGGGNDPIGWHDGTDNPSCTTGGWTCDADNYSTALTVKFYTNINRTNYVGETTANITREEAVGDNCGGNRNHGFNSTLPAGTSGDIYAYAINIEGGSDKLLSGSPKTITCVAPPPTCSGVTFPACITSGASFTVTANGVNNATQVKFPTWSSANGQDDLVWYTDSNGAPWKKNIPQSSHPGGDINVHVYMDNAGYTNVWCDGRNNIPLCCANTAPAGLALTSPTNGVTVDPPVILDWSLTGWGNNCAGPDKQYKVYLDTNPSPTTLLGGPIIITDDSTSFSRTYSSGTPGTTYYWKVAATNDGWATSTETAPRSFTLTTPLPVWFQVVGGDVVAAGGSITSLVPASQSFLTGVKSAVISSGWVSVGTDTANLWKIENTAISPTVMSKNSYAKFRIRVTNRIVPHPTSNLNGLDGLCSISNQAADGACYFITSGPSEITLPGQTISQKIVLLVDGPTQNLKIAGNIDTAGGGLLVVLARNNITLAGPVSILQGIYLADKIFDTGPSTDTALTVTGTVVGLGGVSLSRDVPSDSIPAEKFVFSPEYISALPAGLWEQNRYSQELAP